MVLQTPRGRRRGVVLLVLVFILFLAISSARFYTDILWFQEVGFLSVLWKTLTTQFGLGLAVGLFVALVVWVNLIVAGRVAPPYRTTRFEVVGRVDPLDQYRDLLVPYLKWIRVAVAAFVGVLTGLGASSGWQTFLLWMNRVPFGAKDPQFDLDIGFYVFELPWFNLVLGWLWFAIMASLVLSIAAHFFHGSIRPEGGLRGVWPGALAHVSVLLGGLALVKAAQYWLGRYGLNFSVRGAVTGASYTDVNAHLPALSLLAIISLVSAALFLVNIRFRRLSLPLAAVGLWVFISIVAGALWPGFVQRFSVEPQEFERERPYIERNIAATRAAFGLTDVTTEPYPVDDEVSAEKVVSNEGLVENVRLWDPGILQQAYRQLQAIRTYYQFPDVDIDRYEIDGRMRQVLLSARELSVDDLPEGSRSWVNQHLQYTHGFGLVASLANEQTTAGQPSFLVKDVPGTVTPGAEALALDQPRIYYGEAFEPTEYSIVNTLQEELDYETASGSTRSQYEGGGGVPIGGLFKQLAFAIREGDPNIVLSNQITQESRLLFYRNVRNRVQRAAPFLSLDQDAYVAVVDGRPTWIIDAYTATPYYPYSERADASSILDATTSEGVLSGTVNYVRNSVKVAIDAYDGTMKFYVIDDEDPLIETWRNAFPNLFTDEDPSADLRAHFRYPEDLFKIQSQVYVTYHLQQADRFYARSDEWAIPENQRALSGASGVIGTPALVPPTYLLSELPGSDEEEFLLTRPFTPRARPNMIAFMVARSDPEHYGELLTLEFPPDQQVPGPVQIDNLINQNQEISRSITLLSQRGSKVNFGSLVILPVDDSLLYVQPLFVRANASGEESTIGLTAESSTEGIPELYRVVVVFGETVVSADTFEEALAELFGTEAPPEEEPPDGGGDGQGPGSARLDEIVAEAGDLYDRAQRALEGGDFATYGRLIEQVGELLQEAEGLSNQ